MGAASRSSSDFPPSALLLHPPQHFLEWVCLQNLVPEQLRQLLVFLNPFLFFFIFLFFFFASVRKAGHRLHKCKHKPKNPTARRFCEQMIFLYFCNFVVLLFFQHSVSEPFCRKPGGNINGFPLTECVGCLCRLI